MLIPRLVVCMATMGMTVLGMGVACSQNYPLKPIRIITSDPGGGNDFVSRMIAPGLTSGLGQQVIVDNRASRVTGVLASQAPPDGYTLLLAGGSFAFVPLLEKMSYDPVRDFSPISLTDSSPNVLVVHPAVAANSVKELIALAKAKPGALNYDSGGSGGSLHVAAELFKMMTGTNIVRIPYKGTGPALNDLIGGQLHMVFSAASGAAPHVKSGKLRALAVTSLQPSPLAPGVPTVADSGLPGYEIVSIGFVLAPVKTPAPVVKRLNQEIARVLNQPDLKEKFLNAGVEATPSSPEELGAKIKSDIAKVGKLIKDAGITKD